MECIIIDDRIRHGKPIIRGTRIAVEEILGALSGGMSYEDLESEYGIKKADIIAAINYAMGIIKGEEVRMIEVME